MASFIPTMIFVGFVLGRRLRVVISLSALAWPLLVITDGIDLEPWHVSPRGRSGVPDGCS